MLRSWPSPGPSPELFSSDEARVIASWLEGVTDTEVEWIVASWNLGSSIVPPLSGHDVAVGTILLERLPYRRPALGTEVHAASAADGRTIFSFEMRPQRRGRRLIAPLTRDLFTVEWVDARSEPRLTLSYGATPVPTTDRVILTVSSLLGGSDSTTSGAIGWVGADADLAQGFGEAVSRDWAARRALGQPRWSAVTAATLFTKAMLQQWAEAVWANEQ